MFSLKCHQNSCKLIDKKKEEMRLRSMTKAPVSIEMQKDKVATRKTPPKRSIKQRLRTDLMKH